MAKSDVQLIDAGHASFGRRGVHSGCKRTDLGIGGCWNQALQHKACGCYAVQLDSDDLYSSPHILKKMVDMLRQGKYAMAIGSYTLVNTKLEIVPPGLIDHREWTDENGHNNALRINGLGAPRAFDTGLMRNIGFLNVSYGEDYAAALRICREYRIRRIYESLYLCRRWPGNTDATLSVEEENQKNAFKDKTRTDEILARQNKSREMIENYGNDLPTLEARRSEIHSQDYLAVLDVHLLKLHIRRRYQVLF